MALAATPGGARVRWTHDQPDAGAPAPDENWGDNVSIIGALGVAGPLASFYLPRAVNGEWFRLSVREVLCPKLWPG